MTFHATDPKYRSCCFGLHVSSLASVFMAISVVSYFLNLWRAVGEQDFLQFLGVPVICLGVYAVCKEKRTPLIIYIGLSIVACLSWIIHFLLNVAKGPNERAGLQAYPVALLLSLILFALQFPFIIVFMNLVKFIEDRERSKKNTCLRHV